ncbi:putative 2-haloalkanoic acid dehalogenase [Bisporella sp. PMI_857]|nr:putative 2-haloalkanoic acid dehalogenase [Bisporella sp. PMI_857]
MGSPSKHVVFDVVGTCVSYDVFFESIRKTIGSQLLDQGIKPDLFAFAWLESCEREFAYLSISERYVTFVEVLRSLFYRILGMAGIERPREFVAEEQRDAIVATYSKLGAREGVKETFQLLRDAGFTVWCLSTASPERVQGYFSAIGLDMPAENITSCDTKGIAKPALAVYESVFKTFGKDDVKWFAAAHMWDVSAAHKVGFRGAYCTVYEKESCAEIFGGEMEITTDTLPELARKIIAAS